MINKEYLIELLKNEAKRTEQSRLNEQDLCKASAKLDFINKHIGGNK